MVYFPKRGGLLFPPAYRTQEGDLPPPVIDRKQKFVTDPSVVPDIQNSGTSFWSSIALRFGGFDSNLKAMIAPLNENQSPLIAKLFFQNKLQSVIEFASRNPARAMSIIHANTNNNAQHWGLLLQVACGNSAATIRLLDLIDHQKIPHSAHKYFADSLLEVSRFKADDASRLLRHLFVVADTKTRLSIYEMFIGNERLGSHRVLGDMFVQLMARATPDEREFELYPALDKIVSGNKANSPRTGFVAAMFRGWLSEA